MKIKTLTALAIATLAFGGCVMGSENVYPYEFQTLRVEYSSPTDNSVKTVVSIKGEKQAFHTFGEKETLMIIDKDKIYYADLTSKTGTVSENKTYGELKKLPKEKRAEYLKAVSIGLDKTKNATSMPNPLNQKKVQNIPCDVYESSFLGNVCLWNTIPLEIDPGPENAELGVVATKVEENIDIPDSTFEVPQGVEIKDLSS